MFFKKKVKNDHSKHEHDYKLLRFIKDAVAPGYDDKIAFFAFECECGKRRAIGFTHEFLKELAITAGYKNDAGCIFGTRQQVDKRNSYEMIERQGGCEHLSETEITEMEKGDNNEN